MESTRSPNKAPSQNQLSESIDIKNTPNFSTSRYGRARRPNVNSDYCPDEVLSPMLLPTTPTKNNPLNDSPTIPDIFASPSSEPGRVTINEDVAVEDDQEYDKVLKIISRPLPTVNTSPCSPNCKQSVLKTYSNRKKRFTQDAVTMNSKICNGAKPLEIFSWNQSVNLDMELEEKEIAAIEKITNPYERKLDLSSVDTVLGETISDDVQMILKEFSDNENNVSSSAEPRNDCDSSLEMALNKIVFKKVGEVQSPVIDSSSPMKKAVISNTSTTSTVPEWSEGDIIWSRVGNHPFWPSMVTKDPDTQKYIRQISRGRAKFINQIHVRFFGDSGRRSWVPLSTAMEFLGKTHYDQLAQTITPHMKKRNAQYATSFSVSKNGSTFLKWLEAVEEAESLMDQSIKERFKFFKEVITNKKPKIGNDELAKKYGVLPKKYPSSVKSMKITPAKNPTTSTPNSNTSKRIDLNCSYPMRERKIVERYAASINRKERYSAPLLNLSNIKSKRNSIDSTIDDSEDSMRVESSSPLIRQKKLSLFKGVVKEKFCYICEKNSQVYRCRGGCNRYYHYKCALDPEENAIKPLNELDDSFSDPDNDSICGDSGVKVSRQTLLKKKPLRKLSEAKITPEVFQEMCENAEESGNESDKELEICKIGQIIHITGDSEEINLPLDGKSEFKCQDCQENRLPACFVCNKYEGISNRKKCSYSQCGRVYHPECLKPWPQTQWIKMASRSSKIQQDTLICPLHVCHTCVSDDPRSCKSRCSSERLTRCLRCPTSYHASSYCIPAGSEIVSYGQIVCPKHNHTRKQKFNKHVNASWCFICAIGGSLICCETCPTSFHAECLKITPPEGSYICEECETGRLPLYDEVVWVKLGSYRWWPAQILFPNEIPPNIQAYPHNRGEFVVRFFGSHDYYWVNRGRVFLYQEGDTGHVAKKGKKVDGMFVKALKEAANMYRAVKLDRQRYEDEISTVMKPPPYIKIKANRPVGTVRISENDTSSLTPCECDQFGKDPCGPDSDCLNRLLLTECNPEICPAGQKCCNQQFEKRIYPELTPYKTASRGWGLKTLEKLTKGQFIIEYVGEMINAEEYRSRLKRMHEQSDENYYFLTIDKDTMIDAGPKGNVARFMNHSCQPNCETQKWTVNGNTRVGLFALEDLPEQTELTFNYNLESIGKEKKVCKCGAPLCSGYIGVKVVNNKKKPKKDKTEDLKGKKKKKKSYSVKLRKSNAIQLCFACGKGGAEGKCQLKNCSKTYHLACVDLDSWPTDAKWLCPRHICAVCQIKRTAKRCSICIRSFCSNHESHINKLEDNGQYVCSNHELESSVNNPTEEIEPLSKRKKIPTLKSKMALLDQKIINTKKKEAFIKSPTINKETKAKSPNLNKEPNVKSPITETKINSPILNIELNDIVGNKSCDSLDLENISLADRMKSTASHNSKMNQKKTKKSTTKIKSPKKNEALSISVENPSTLSTKEDEGIEIINTEDGNTDEIDATDASIDISDESNDSLKENNDPENKEPIVNVRTKPRRRSKRITMPKKRHSIVKKVPSSNVTNELEFICAKTNTTVNIRSDLKLDNKFDPVVDVSGSLIPESPRKRGRPRTNRFNSTPDVIEPIRPRDKSRNNKRQRENDESTEFEVYKKVKIDISPSRILTRRKSMPAFVYNNLEQPLIEDGTLRNSRFGLRALPRRQSQTFW